MSDYICDTCSKNLKGEELYKATITCKKCHDKRITRLGQKLNEAMETLAQAGMIDIYNAKKV